MSRKTARSEIYDALIKDSIVREGFDHEGLLEYVKTFVRREAIVQTPPQHQIDVAILEAHGLITKFKIAHSKITKARIKGRKKTRHC